MCAVLFCFILFCFVLLLGGKGREEECLCFVFACHTVNHEDRQKPGTSVGPADMNDEQTFKAAVPKTNNQQKNSSSFLSFFPFYFFSISPDFIADNELVIWLTGLKTPSYLLIELVVWLTGLKTPSYLQLTYRIGGQVRPCLRLPGVPAPITAANLQLRKRKLDYCFCV